ncbi:MAG: hypothetical protein JW958_12725 [Candidatus Eisenbacteria bacterium]|nr:hypothetical protein [Candidatus Eisenbacteria bacterium]
MRIWLMILCLLALAAGVATAGVAPERADVKPIIVDEPASIRPADPIAAGASENMLFGATTRAVVPPMTLPVDGTWCGMNCDNGTVGLDGQGGWQSDPCFSWETTSPFRVVLLISDFLVVGDKYQVWVDGAPAGHTGGCIDDGSYYGLSGIGGDNYALVDQSEGCDGWNEPDLSTGVVVIPPGTHEIQIKCHRFATGYEGSFCIIKAEERWARCPMFNGSPKTMVRIGAEGEEATSWGSLKTLFR